MTDHTKKKLSNTQLFILFFVIFFAIQIIRSLTSVSSDDFDKDYKQTIIEVNGEKVKVMTPPNSDINKELIEELVTPETIKHLNEK